MLNWDGMLLKGDIGPEFTKSADGVAWIRGFFTTVSFSSEMPEVGLSSGEAISASEGFIVCAVI